MSEFVPDSKEKETPKPSVDNLEDLFPDVDIPHLTAVVQLLYNLGREINDIENIEATPYVVVDINNTQWEILNNDEAETRVEELVEDTAEIGMDNLDIKWGDYVTNRDVFESELADNVLNSIDQMREDTIDDSGRTTLDIEMEEAGTATEEEFSQYLMNKWSEGDTVQWYIDKFGFDAFKNLAAINTDALVNHIIKTEGRESILSSNGEELDLGNGYFAYRVN